MNASSSVSEVGCAEGDFLPADLDHILRERILRWCGRRGFSYVKLAIKMREYVSLQYEMAHGARGCELVVQRHLDLHCPGKSFLNNYANGGAMCFRYINTVANFFGVQYTLGNFDPSQDFVRMNELVSGGGDGVS